MGRWRRCGGRSGYACWGDTCQYLYCTGRQRGVFRFWDNINDEWSRSMIIRQMHCMPPQILKKALLTILRFTFRCMLASSSPSLDIQPVCFQEMPLPLLCWAARSCVLTLVVPVFGHVTTWRYCTVPSILLQYSSVLEQSAVHTHIVSACKVMLSNTRCIRILLVLQSPLRSALFFVLFSSTQDGLPASSPTAACSLLWM